jgi:exopolysaccharide production protein ExoZ
VPSDVVRPERIAALDGLRGLMAWAVALYHFGLLAHAFEPGSTLSSAITVLGLHSVEAFFIISGFCLFYLHGQLRPRGPAMRRFYLQRFARIAPVFYLVLALNLVLHAPAGPPLTWRTFLENLTFTFGLHHPNYALVIGGWSIGLEMLFYASFPLLAVVFRSTVGFAVATFAAVAIAGLYSASVVEPAADAARFNAYVPLPNHAYAFLLGGWVAKLLPVVRARVSFPLACAVLAAGLAVWLAQKPVVIDHFDVVLGRTRACYVAAALLCVALAVFTRVTSPRAQRRLEAFGELSYPVYLLHPLAWVLCSRWLPRGTPAMLALGAALVLTAALAWVVARWFERPIRGVLTAGLARRSRSGTPGPFAVDSAPHGPVFRS